MTEPTDIDRAEYALLDFAGEDDWGLWEAMDVIRTVFPELDEQAGRALAGRAIANLVERGHLRLLRGRALDEDGPAEPADVSALADPASFEPAGDAPEYLSIAITPAGEEAYYALPPRPRGPGASPRWAV